MLEKFIFQGDCLFKDISENSEFMAISPSKPLQARRHSRFEWFLLLVFAVVAIGFCTVPLLNHLHKVHHGQPGTKDYPIWYNTGYRELHGITPYYPARFHEYPFMYPPGAAVVLAVMSIGGRIWLMIMQVLLNTLGWAIAIIAPVWLLTGKQKPGELPTDRYALMFWLPSVVCLFFIWDTYLEGQVAFILSSCLLLMFVCMRQKRHWGTGLALAVAAGLKGFPILALPYLIWRRQWKAIGYLCGFLLLFVLVLPAFFRGPTGAFNDLKAWSINMMAKQTPTVIGQRASRSYTWQNGSLTSVANRLLRPVVADHDTGLRPIRVNVANVPFHAIEHLVDAAAVLLGLGFLAVMPWRDSRRTAFTDTAEAAMLLIMVILFDPLSFTYNNSWLMCPIAVVVYFVTTRARSRAQSVVAAAWLAIALSLLIFTIPNPHFRYVRALGNTFFADVLVLVELGWILLLSQKWHGHPAHEMPVTQPDISPASIQLPDKGQANVESVS